MRIYCEIFLVIGILAVAYQSLIIVLRLLNISAIKLYFRWFLLIDHIINNICMGLFVGSIVGSYLMGWLWSSYASATSEQSDNNADTIVTILMYMAFVSSSTSVTYMFTLPFFRDLALVHLAYSIISSLI